MNPTVRRPLAVRLLSLSLPLTALTGALGCGDTIRVSVSSEGEQGNLLSRLPAPSATGRFVAFQSVAFTLVPDDRNSRMDVFVRELGTGTTTRVSVDSAGNEADGNSFMGGMSAGGRFVVFYSDADDLIPSDPNGFEDVFRHDRLTGVTELCSADPVSLPANGHSRHPAVSADGRFVAFQSRSPLMVADDTNGWTDVFVHDRATGETTRVSVDSDGAEGMGESLAPSLSADGRFVGFTSRARLSPDHVHPIAQAYVHDRATGETTCVSCGGGAATGAGGGATISADGRWVAFHSDSWNLVPADHNSEKDAFLLDRSTGDITRVSVSSEGEEGNQRSITPVVSADGRVVVFTSEASNLVRSDTNQVDDVFVHYRDVANEGKQ